MARSFGLGSQKAWTAWSKEGMRPRNVPANPQTTYKDRGWQGWGHWLGTGNVWKGPRKGSKQPLPFGTAPAPAPAGAPILPGQAGSRARCESGGDAAPSAPPPANLAGHGHGRDAPAGARALAPDAVCNAAGDAAPNPRRRARLPESGGTDQRGKRQRR